MAACIYRSYFSREKDKSDEFLKKSEEEYLIVSAGLSAVSGMDMNERAKKVLQEEGYSPSDHCSQPLDEELLRGADLILTMTSAQAKEIMKKHARAEEIVYSLGNFLGRGFEIKDPIGASPQVYREICEQFQKMSEELEMSLKNFFSDREDEK